MEPHDLRHEILMSVLRNPRKSQIERFRAVMVAYCGKSTITKIACRMCGGITDIGFIKRREHYFATCGFCGKVGDPDECEYEKTLVAFEVDPFEPPSKPVFTITQPSPNNHDDNQEIQ